MWSDLKIRFASIFRRAAMEREMAEELRAHIELETDKLVRSGVPRHEAHRQASAAFGGIELVKERSRDARGTRWIEEVWKDACYAVRLFGRQRRFTAALVVTMAMGVGANTAITGAIDEILWRPLTVPNADRIIGVFGFDRSSSRYQSISLPDIRDLERAASLEALAAYWRRPMRMSFDTRVETVSSEVVTSSYFRVLAAPFVIGRPISREDDSSSAPVAVISARLWRERFGAAADIVGQTIRLEGQNVSIVGVASRQFRGDHNLNWYTPADVWVPAAAVPSLNGKRYEALFRNRAVPIFGALGLLRSGVSTSAAEAELNSIFTSVRPASPAATNHVIRVFPSSESKFYPGYRATFARNLSAFGMVAILVLLLAAANVANLLVERTTRRRRELAVRAALGADRGRIVRQLFIEGLVLAAPGFVLSVLIAAGLQRLLIAFPSALGVDLSVDLGVTWRVLAYCGGVSVLIAAIVSAIAAMRSATDGAGPLLKHAAAGSARPHRSWVSQSLTVVQVGLSAVLLVGSLIVARGLWAASTKPLGFDLSQVIVLSVDRYSQSSGEAAPLPPTTLDRGAWLPAGVTHLAFSSSQPLTGGSTVTVVQDAAGPRTSVQADTSFVSVEFFEALRIPILSGRVFDRSDATASQTVIVNSVLARRLWGAESALGQTITIDSKSLTVVGVAGDTRYRDVWDPGRPQVYRPIGPDSEHVRTILVRTDGPPDAVLRTIVPAWTRLAPAVPMEDAMTGDGLRSRALKPMRLTAALIGAFAFVAIGIASVGLYSTIAWFVEQRSRDIAVRIAIGGLPSRIGGQVMAKALALTIVGLAFGFAIGVRLVPWLSGLTHGLTSADPWVLTTSTVVLMGAAVLAAAIPTLRAVRIDPIVILKSE